MKIAVLSDIHANLEALHEAVSLAQSRSVDHIVCLGDIVGYGADPNECITRIREVSSSVLLGNHDQAAVDLATAQSFNTYALAAARWTHRVLTEEHKQYLSNLPYTCEIGELLFVHASPYQPEAWHYILSSADARDNFEHFVHPICFVGHSHVATIFGEPGARRQGGSIKRGEKYIINVGSVGQPRDGDWRLSFGIFDTGTWTYENIRSEYDVQTASEKILKAGLPRVLSERILFGR